VPAAAPAAAEAAGLSPVGGVNFDQPVYVTQPPGVGDLLVVEKPGVIRAVDSTTNLVLPTPFLDIQSLVSDDGERGLLSVAFPPGYASSGRLYVFYTNLSGNLQIDEFRRSSADANQVLPASRRKVIVVPHPNHANHNGGQLQFDGGGRLYISTGDGGGGGDSDDNARRKSSLLGKILRIDPRETSTRRYRIPSNNPYVGRPGRNEIFSYGLRNPFRFSLYSPPGGPTRILIGDVGQAKAEEVDYETLHNAKGANFGWPAREGFSRFEPSRRGADPPEQPIFAYRHGGYICSGPCAITGGYVIRGAGIPELEGRYVYADFFEGNIRSFSPRLSGAVGDSDTGLDVPQLSSFGRDRSSNFYAASLAGPVFRFIP
jgi:glucose/arabinose dehydrogenase